MYKSIDWDLLQQSSLINTEVNPFRVRWFKVKSNEFLNPKTLYFYSICLNDLIEDLVEEANERDDPNRYFLDNLHLANIPIEVREEYNLLVTSPLFKLLGYFQLAAYYIFYSWRKYFHNWVHIRKDTEGFYKYRLLRFSHFLFIKDTNEKSLIEFRTEVVVPDFSHLLLSITLGGEEFFHFNIGLGLFSIYFSLHIPFIYSRIAPHFNWWNTWKSYNTGINIHDWTIWVRLWHNEDYDQLKRSWSLNLERLFLGNTTYSNQEICSSYFELKLPERLYIGTAKLSRVNWVRDRFPWLKKSIIRCELNVPEGIPIPGKGENDWDLEDDKSYSFSSELTGSIEDSINKWIDYTISRRLKHGGEDWINSLEKRSD